MARIDAIDAGAGGWLFVCAAIVLLMAPALALFYRGVLPATAARSTWIRWMLALPILAVQWAVLGYSLAFGPTRHGLIGGLSYAGMRSGFSDVQRAMPAFAFAACQMMFAVIAPALVSSVVGARMKTGAYVAFVLCWSTLVYDPVAHWLWAHGGWLNRIGALDYAGGLAAHGTAGVAAVVCVLVTAKGGVRAKQRIEGRPAATVLTGVALLWLGWSAANLGSALASDGVVGQSFLATQLGAAGGAVGWLVVEWSTRGRPTAIGVASGVVSGLVATTPAAGFVAPSAACAIGFIAGSVGFGTRLGVVSAFIAGLLAITAAAGRVEPTTAIAIAAISWLICHAAVFLKRRFASSSTPDPFAVQGVGGLAGALLTGVFAQKALSHHGADGALFGNLSQLVVQAVACVAVGTYAALATFVILKVIDVTIGLQVPEARSSHVNEEITAQPPAARAA